MKKNSIQHPDIAIKLSIKAYTNAQKQYNDSIKKKFAESPASVFPELTEKELIGKTIQGLILKDVHFQLFIELLNIYQRKVNKMQGFFNNPAIVSDVVENRNMYIMTGELGAITSRQNVTMRERLRRLEMADIIEVKFHGHKKPLEVIFNKEICLIFDRRNMDYMPESRFLSDCDSVFLVTYNQIPNNIKGLYAKTNNNITIGEEGVESNRITDENRYVAFDILKDTETKQKQLKAKTPKGSIGTDHNFHDDGIVAKENNLNTDENLRTVYNILKETVTTQKQLKAKTAGISTDTDQNFRVNGTIAKENNRNTDENLRTVFNILKDSTTTQKQLKAKTAEESISKGNDQNLRDDRTDAKTHPPREKDLATRRREAIIHYSKLFYAYMKEKLFPDKYYSPEYEIETLNYIAKNYFASKVPNHTITHFDKLWANNYKIRIDIAEKWISRFKTPGGDKFDTTYFYPKSFLEVERRGRGILSFANTEKFLQKSKQYAKVNNYRKLDDEGRHKLNAIARQLENGKIDYQTALEKVKSITRDSDEYVKQLNARWFGLYQSMKN